VAGQDYKSTLPIEHPAIAYEQEEEPASLGALARGLTARTLTASSEPGVNGPLSPLLAALGISAESQMLVFSKTSVQAARVSPSHPRAVYFSDDVAIAFVPGAPTIELAATDPVRGTLFYTLARDGSDAPTLTRQASCLRCHRGANTAGVPGMYVGSVIPGPTGAPVADDTAIITDHRTPFADRWGGWYVTARRGEQLDRANAVATDPAAPSMLQRESRQNLTTLAGRFPPAGYLADASDIVALMVFEHQTQMLNLITRVGWEQRMAAATAGPTATTPALDADIEELVSYMLFRDEAPLVEPVEGTTRFARTFAEAGARDRRGRSLRELDLRTRLFRYPLSYLIFSPSFDALPDHARNRIYRRLYDLLSSGRPLWKGVVSPADRQATIEIVADGKANVPDYWRRTRPRGR
jgi:hypothetical protein